jgi:hypothetical protein
MWRGAGQPDLPFSHFFNPEPEGVMSKKHMPQALVVAYHVRGRVRRSSLTRRCFTLQDIIRQGEELFPLFLSRNPWISVDSRRNTVFVGVDPEEQNLTDEAKLRCVSK